MTGFHRRAALLLLAHTLPCAAGADDGAGARRVVALEVRDAVASGPGLVGTGRGAPTLRLRQGEQLELHWTSDRPLVLHLHGYGLETVVPADRPAVTSFTARAAGRFPVETHAPSGRHVAVLYIEVHPR